MTVTGGNAQTLPLDRVTVPDQGPSKGEAAQVGALGLSVSAPEKVEGNLRVHYQSSDDGTTSSLQGSINGDLSREHPLLYTTAPLPVRVGGNQPTALPLRFALPADADVRNASGLLTLRLRKDGDVVAAANISVAAQAPTVVVAPATVRVRVTRWLGPVSYIFPSAPGLSGNESTVQVLGRGASVIAEGPRAPETLLNSDQSGELHGQLSLNPDTANTGLVYGTFAVHRAKRTGSYGGTIYFNPRQGTPTAPATVEVQDAFPWPLLALLISAWLGARLVLWGNLRRRRGVLQVVVKDSIRPYFANQELGEARLPIFSIDKAVIEEDGKLPNEDDCKQELEDRSHVAKLYCRIQDTASDDEFTKLTKDINDGLAAFRRWQTLAEQYPLLKAELDASQLPPIDAANAKADPAAKDAYELLVLTGSDPETDESTSKLATRMREQRGILRSYLGLRRKWNSLTKEQQQLVPDCDPVVVYVLEAKRDAAATAVLNKSLVIARQRLDGLPPPREAKDLVGKNQEQIVEVLGMAAPTSALLAFAPSATPAVTVAAPAPVVPPPFHGDLRSRGQILSGVRRWDRVVALITFLVTAVAFLLPKYTEHHTWGSWADYAQLIAFGFLGAAITGGFAMNWQLFPSLRSYSADVPAAPQPPKTDGPGADGPAPPTPSGPAAEGQGQH